MDNPGVYAEHLQPDAWPFLAFLGAIAFVPLFLLGALMLQGGRTPNAKVRGGLALAISIGVLGISVAGLTSANETYYAAEDSSQSLYREEVHAWALSTYGLDLTADELSSLLNQETIVLNSSVPPQRAHLMLDRANDQIAIVNDSDQTIAVQG